MPCQLEKTPDCSEHRKIPRSAMHTVLRCLQAHRSPRRYCHSHCHQTKVMIGLSQTLWHGPTCSHCNCTGGSRRGTQSQHCAIEVERSIPTANPFKHRARTGQPVCSRRARAGARRCEWGRAALQRPRRRHPDPNILKVRVSLTPTTRCTSQDQHLSFKHTSTGDCNGG